jgi:YD repeat-containing protein
MHPRSTFRVSVGVLALVLLGAAPVGAQTYGDGRISSCRNSNTVCEDCEDDRPGPGTACAIAIRSAGASSVDNPGLEHHHRGLDYIADPRVADRGCVACGGPAAEPRPDARPSLRLQRTHRYRFSGFPSSFGPGVYLAYDHHLELDRRDPITGGGEILYFSTDARRRVRLTETSVLYGDDSQDGIYHDPAFATISELRLLDGAGAPVVDQAQAVTAVLRQHDGTRHVFELIRIDPDPATTQRWARLIRQEDRNGDAVVLGYTFPRDVSDPQLAGSRSRLWQIATITDAHGRVARVNYASGQVAGRWVVGALALPDGTTVTYDYDASGLTRVTYPDGGVSSITRGNDPVRQQTVIGYVEAGAEGVNRREEVRLSTSSHLNGDGTISNQTAGMVRSILNGAGEYVYFNQEDPADNQAILIYDGGDTLYRLTTSGFDHVRKAEVATTWRFGQSLTGVAFQLLEAYETNPQAMITRRTDVLGRTTAYQIDVRSARVTRITHPDGTHTTFGQLTSFARPR